MDKFEIDIAKRYESLTNKKVLYEDNNTFYIASDIGKILQIKNIRSTNYLDNERQMRKIKTNGGVQNKTVLTFIGLKKLLTNSRSMKVTQFAKDLGFDISIVVKSTIESDTLNSIITAFECENIISQYMVGKYRIDLYFSKYNLAIECDEKHHDKQIEEDIIRENYIKEKINCTFIRFKPYDKDFNIFKVINSIYKHIKEFHCISDIGTNSNAN